MKCLTDKTLDTPFLSERDGCLIFDGVNLAKFAEEHNTPAYIFSERAINHNYDRIRRAFSVKYQKDFDIAYSIKNNFIPMIVDIIGRKNSWFEVTSKGEMQLLQRLGVSLSRCIYTNIWKSEEDIRYALRNKVGFMAIDSLSDMRRISNVARELRQKVRVLIRVNPAIEIKDAIFASAVPWSKTGVEIVQKRDDMIKGEDAINVVEKSLEDSNFIVSGLHGHLGSQITDMKYYNDFSRKICELYNNIKDKFGVALGIIDFGGGYPINYDDTKPITSIDKIAEKIISNLNSAGIVAKIIVESGRYITGNAGILITRIVCVKHSPTVGKIVVTDASAYNELLDSVLVHWFFNMTIVNKMEDPMDEIVRVVGGTTDSIDAFDPLKENTCPKCHKVIEDRRNRLLQRSEEGDILGILGAGAYTTCFNMNYCLRAKPAIYLIKNNRKVVIARREEKIEDILRCCKMPKRMMV
jgi:diaminopimelate decarboxylase